MHAEVLFTPVEFEALGERDLSGAVCVVFDVLRATSTMVTALAAGARGILPVSTIEEALAVRHRDSTVVLAGERQGLRIGADASGGEEFDLGNSPREFTQAAVGRRVVVMTTTNGTRALRACAGAPSVWAGSFLNLEAIVAGLRALQPSTLVIVCSGTGEGAAYEDTLAAGALCEALGAGWERDDSALIAGAAWRDAVTHQDWTRAVRGSRNARRLQGLPELAADLEFCLRTGVFDVVPRREGDLFVK